MVEAPMKKKKKTQNKKKTKKQKQKTNNTNEITIKANAICPSIFFEIGA